MTNQIEFCFIEDFPSLKEGIFSICGISKSGLKKFQLKRNFLEKNIRKKDKITLPINILNYGSINPLYEGLVPEIAFEDENFILLCKPHRVHSHPLSYDEKNNLLSFISSSENLTKKRLLEVNSQKYDRGLVYRLDYETSGLIYYAKSDSIYSEMRTSFNTLVKKKMYLAIVEGEVQNQNIEHFLTTKESKGSLTKEDASGKKCRVEIRRLDYNLELNQSLVSVKLEEGFKHQIRAQLALVGYPILGDVLYGANESQRMWLHCYQYCFDFNGISYDTKDTSKELESFLANFNCKL
jgi:23S rRNA pseudouridine1911/1915/1917 synthase